MNIEEFIQKLEVELEDIESGTLKSETKFRTIPGWSSMHALIIIAFADTEYNITVTGEDLRSCITVNDLFEIVISRI